MFTLRVKVQDDGSILIKGLPLKPGDCFEVSVKPVRKPPDPDNPDPLRGLPYKYYLPFEPVDQENWEALLEEVSPYEREGDPALLPPDERAKFESKPPAAGRAY